MIPILYDTVTEGTVPTSYGVGSLTDCISCTVKEERNGAFELAMEYAADGIHADEIAVNKIIKAKPNFTDAPQLFRIYKVGKAINGLFSIAAQHISYDLSGKLITTGSSGSCVGACALLEASAGNFTITTDKSVSAPFSVSEPSSVRSWFGGKAGSLLDVYGGEWQYDNYTASLKQARGQDRGVQIRFGKNLTDLTQDLSAENLVTGILPYYIDQDGNKTIGTKVTTGLVLDVDRDLAVDFSQSVDPESATPIATQLATLANKYIADNNLTAPVNSITLDFVQLSNLQDRVDLCDTVSIYFEALGISASLKCIATVWDVLEERYASTTFGEAQTNITDTIAKAEKTIAKVPSVSFMSEAIKHATDLITGNLGGYVVFHDSDNNGEPDEILIMDTPDISTAVKVWRWNQNGLGYSGTGYAGPYSVLALTADGKIVADAITTGTLNADLIKAGVIEDTGHNSTINMTTGLAVLKDLTSKGKFRLVNSSNVEKAYLAHTVNDGVTFRLLDNSNNIGISIDINQADERVIGVFDPNSSASANLFMISGQAALRLNNANGDLNVYAEGQTGTVTCISVIQTSSRKEKENIRPIEDASKILELEAVAFDFKDKAKGTDRRGFIAEDVAEILPNLVKPESENGPASLDYIGMIPYLQAVIKEQEARIKALEEKLNGTAQP